MRALLPLGLPTIGPIMQALRLNEVLMRVVAWHNQHPLARRITATQVHSIGEVVLPFASALPAPAAPNAPTTADPPAAWDDTQASPSHPPPELRGDAAGDSPAEPANPAPPAHSGPEARGSQGPASPEPTSEPEPEPAPMLSMEDEADDLFSGGAAAGAEISGHAEDKDAAAPDDDGPEMLIELSADLDEPSDTPPDLPPQAAPDGASDASPDPPAIDTAPPIEATDTDSAELTAAFGAATANNPMSVNGDQAAASPSLAGDASAPVGTALDPVQAGAAPRPSPNTLPHPQPPTATAAAPGWLVRLRAWLQSWRPGRRSHGLPKLAATFSRDFIWPLPPARVARWARQHGSLQSLAPPDWPQRRIDTDNRLQAKACSQGLSHDLPLHVLTAAIGVGDRRIRVLIDAQGHVLGPRSYSPPKLAGLASVVALGLLGAGWGGLPRGESLRPQQASGAVAAAASAAAQAASAAALAAAAASAAESVWRAEQAVLAAATRALPSANEGDSSPSTSPVAPAPADDPATSAPNHKPAPAEAAAPDRAIASTVATTMASLALGPALPAISPADKQTARLQSEALRSGKAAADAAAAPKPPSTVFAIVTHPTREKESAVRSLALIRASSRRLGDDAPAHGELMQDQGTWRAVWWPFESQADAERARVMMAARGVPSEVVEF